MKTTSTNVPLASFRRSRLPQPEPGFLGPGHTAILSIPSNDLGATDPFVMLNDDRISFAAGRKIGEAHPHSGLETVTLLVDGAVEDRDEGALSAGDLVWMTAGRGIVHGERMYATGTPTRILQLWVTLSEKDREADPRVQRVLRDSVPVIRQPGVTARLYSGSSNGLTAATLNHVPLTLLEVELAPGAVFEHELSASDNGFLYPLDGETFVGDDASPLRVDDIAWLDRRMLAGASSVLRLRAGSTPSRLVVYLGQRQDEPNVQHGPFVAASEAAIQRAFARYRRGEFTPVSQLGHEPALT